MICDSLFHNIYTEDKNFLECFAYFTERSRLGTYGKSKKVPLAPVVLDSEPNPDNIAYFSYDPLPSDQKRNNSSHSIRLLRLLPSENSSAPTKCDIIILPLESAPVYETLSYTWESNTQGVDCVITCCSKRLPIRRNSYLALTRIRLSTEPRLIWADAICINQADEAEKAQQVGLMRYVYSRADQVVIWLGDDSLNSHSALELLRKLLSVPKKEDETTTWRGSIMMAVRTIILLFPVSPKTVPASEYHHLKTRPLMLSTACCSVPTLAACGLSRKSPWQQRRSSSAGPRM
jgi:hypothetical protein